MAVKDSVAECVAPILAALGYELVEVTYLKKVDGMHLTIFIDTDKQGGISLEDCEKVSAAVDAPLEKLDPTNAIPYALNISSPGLDRPIKTDKDFNKNIGKEIELSFYVTMDGSKKMVAELISFDSESIDVKTAKNKTFTILRKDIAVAKPHIKF